MKDLEFRVRGLPQPKGSLTPVVMWAAGLGAMVTTKARPPVRVWMKESNLETLSHWRDLVKIGAVEAAGGFLQHPGPLEVEITFWLQKPKSMTQKFFASVGGHIVKKPDVDKLARAVLDALTDARLYVDDSQVTDLLVRKRYVSTAHAHPGALIRIREAPPCQTPSEDYR